MSESSWSGLEASGQLSVQLGTPSPSESSSASSVWPSQSSSSPLPHTSGPGPRSCRQVSPPDTQVSVPSAHTPSSPDTVHVPPPSGLPSSTRPLQLSSRPLHSSGVVLKPSSTRPLQSSSRPLHSSMPSGLTEKSLSSQSPHWSAGSSMQPASQTA